MTPNQLKNSILQLAIQGKLVEQHPEEGTAEELYKQIQAEKAELIKQGKIKKDKNESTIIKRGNSYFEIIGTTEKCIDDELPFEIPDTWRWARLGNIFSVCSGTTPNTGVEDYYKDGNINWVRTTDLNNGKLLSCQIKITEKAFKECNLSIIPKNSVCIALYGGKGTIGKHSILEFETTINQSVCAIKPNNYIDMNYFHFFIEYQRPNWMKFASGSRKDPNINQIIVKKCIVPLPPLAEQHRIVAKIEELLPMVEKYGEAYNKLETLNKNFPAEIKKSILQYAIQGKLTEEFRAQSEEHREDPFSQPNGCQLPQQQSFGGASSLAPTRSAPKKLGEVSRSDERGLIDLSAEELLVRIQAEKAELIKQGKIKKEKPLPPIKEEEIPFEIPDTWEWVRFGDAIKLTSGQDLQPSQYNDKNDGIPYLTGASNIDNEQVVINRWTPEPRSYAYKGDLLLTCKGTVGKTAILKEEKVHIARQIMAISLICGLDIKYVEAFIKSQIEHLKNNAKSIIPGIERNKVLNLVFPLPPLNEQQAIVTKIEKLFSLANTLTKKV